MNCLIFVTFVSPHSREIPCRIHHASSVYLLLGIGKDGARCTVPTATTPC